MIRGRVEGEKKGKDQYNTIEQVNRDEFKIKIEKK